MSDGTKISWTDATWNPIRSLRNSGGKVGWHCEKVSAGCANCYAERFNGRNLPGGGTGLRYNQVDRELVTTLVDDVVVTQPGRWKTPRRIFVCSMTDLFGEWVTDAQIDRVFASMISAGRHTYQILTKRAERMRAYLSDPTKHDRWNAAFKKEFQRFARNTGGVADRWWPEFSQSIWIGVSVEDQATADARVPVLLETPAAVRFVSSEPLLAPIDLSKYLGRRRDESGGDGVPRANDSRDVFDRSRRDDPAAQGMDEGDEDRIGSGVGRMRDATSGRKPIRQAARGQHDLPTRHVRGEGSQVAGRGSSGRMDGDERRANRTRPGDQPQERERRGQPAVESRSRDRISERDPLDPNARFAKDRDERIAQRDGEAGRDEGRADSSAGSTPIDAAAQDRRAVRSHAIDDSTHRYQGDVEARPRLSWVIVGGESGPGARPFDIAWARSLIWQCKVAGVACFVKQLGRFPYDEVGGRHSLRTSTAMKQHSDPAEWPADLRVREFPS